MIVDPSGRYLATRLLSETGISYIWSYDRRWRTVHTLDLPEHTQIGEGAGHFSLAFPTENGWEVSVRSARNTSEVLASALFDGTQWDFTGDKEAWALVPDYIVVTANDGEVGLLRIADGGIIQLVEEVKDVIQVVDVPESRLVVLMGKGEFWIYDPIAPRVLFNHQLAEKNEAPVMRFRTSDEVWVNDATTMLKLDAKKFDVTDAAGSELEGEEGTAGWFGRWTFAGRNELCVVPRPDLGDVLVLDAVSMLPVGQAVLAAGAIDAAMVGRNTVVGVANDGRVLRTRLRKVKVLSKS